MTDQTQYGDHSLARRAREVMSGGITRSTVHVQPHPPYITSGSGCFVTDQLGHRALDCNNNYTALIHGHAFEPITTAVTNQLARGTAFGLPTEGELVLAEMLASRTKIPMWRFINSGTEAVMTALRGARAFTGRDIVVRFAGSYHGMHDSVVDPAAPGVPAALANASIVIPQGDREAFDEVMKSQGSQVAAVLIDLMPNRTGLIPADHDFVQQIRQSTAKHGALLIVDEVITFRLAVGGMHTTYGVQPDLIALGKVIGGGFPVGAVGGNADVMAVFDPSGPSPVWLGGTFSANPVTMMAGAAALEHLDDAAIDRLNAMGDRLRDHLRDAGIDVNGSGSLARLHTDTDQRTLWWRMYQSGLLTGTSTLMSLSTPMTNDDVDSVAKVVIDAVRAG